MKKLLLTGVAVLLLFLRPAFANHGLEALSVLVPIFFGLVGVGVLAIVFSIVAYRSGKTVWKVLATLPTIGLAMVGLLIFSQGGFPLLGLAFMAVALVNVLLITNARKPKQQDVAAP